MASEDELGPYAKASPRKNALGRTDLHNAVGKGDEEAVRQLLQSKADLDAKDGSGWTSLHLAAQEGKTQILQLLLEAKASTEIVDESGRTPLVLADYHNQLKSVEVLRNAASTGGDTRGKKFPYDDMAENALFLVSCTTTLDAGKLSQINKERREKGEKEISDAQNAQRLLHNLEVDGFGVLGCDITDLMKEQIPEDKPLLECVAVKGMKPLISDFDLHLKQGLGKTHTGEDAWIEHYRHYATKTKFGVLIMAGDVNFFRLWAESRACRREVEKVPEDRLFAYLDGCLVRVNQPGSNRFASHKAGPGYMVWRNGDLYVGALKQRQPWGYGKIYFQGGDVYEGNFLEGKMDSNTAKYIYANGDCLEGTWKDGKAVLEKCSFTFATGKKLENPWPTADLDAKGIQEFASGQVKESDPKVKETSKEQIHVDEGSAKVKESSPKVEESGKAQIQGDDGSSKAADAAEAKKYRDILEAAEKGNVAAVRHFVTQDPAAVKQKDGDGQTALHKAAIYDDWPDVCRVLLEHGADVQAAESAFGWTPLHCAAANGRVEGVKVLLEFGADIHVKNKDGETAMDYAKEEGETEVVKLLEEAPR